MLKKGLLNKHSNTYCPTRHSIGENRAFILKTSEVSITARMKRYSGKTYLNSDVYERHPFQKRFLSVRIFDQLLDRLV